MTVCARSWGDLATGWRFCDQPKGHIGACSCNGLPKQPDELFYEQQPEAKAEIAKQIEDDRKKESKKKRNQ